MTQLGSSEVIEQTCCAGCGQPLHAAWLCSYECEFDGIEGPRTLVTRRWVPEAEVDRYREFVQRFLAWRTTADLNRLAVEARAFDERR